MRIWAIVWVFGCLGNGPERTDVAGEPGTPCDPALSIVPAEAVLAPDDRVQLSGRGGTRRYTYTLQEPAFGRVNPRTGVYVAPAETGATDRVEVRDERCDDVAVAEITIGDGFIVRPSAATVLPQTTFTVEISGGTGDVLCGLSSTGSGASFDPDTCVYQAGKKEGVDRLEVRDRALDVTIPVTVTVSRDARLDVWGHDLWAIPLGSTFLPEIAGGSQVYDLTITAGPARLVAGALVSDAAGRGSASVVDRFAGFTETLDYEVVPLHAPRSDWFGKHSVTGVVLGAGDLDQDGEDDVVIGFPEVNGGGVSSGAVLVYPGVAGGFGDTPALALFGDGRDALLGSAVAVADLDGDGALDLVAGEPGGGVVGPQQGRIRIWSGLADGWFGSEDEVRSGEAPGDRAGTTVAACDFDNDGWLDLAVGAPGHEERGNGTVVEDTGAVFVYRGAATGLAAAPTVVRYGVRVDDALGAFAAMPDTRLGIRGMAAGDLDGDGRCDLVVASDRGLYGSPDPYGFVAVYDGLDAADGLLTAQPTRIVANLTDRDARLGSAIAAGDLDDDGASDLVIGAPQWDGAAPDSGAVYVFLAASLDSRAAHDPYTPDDADWAEVGDAAGNRFGTSVALGDVVREDGVPELLIGEPRGELPGGRADLGRVHLYEGTSLLKDGPAFFEAAGPEPEGWFGQAAAPVGDVDGDGLVDVVVLAGRTDDDGIDVGGVFLARGDGDVDWLGMAGEAAGHEHGAAVAVFDLNGDGIGDAVLGSPGDGDDTDILTGSVHAVGSTVRFGVDADATDRQGAALASSGDLDGDGTDDLAVVSAGAGRPAGVCDGEAAGVGVVRVYAGRAGARPEQPTFVAYGPAAGRGIDTVATGFDYNGDGYDDLAYGGVDWFGTGGFALVLGRDSGAGTEALCGPQVWEGLTPGDQLGSALTGLRDLDGDGCDELVVAAAAEDAGEGNQGVVRVLWGFGPTCTGSVRRVTTLESGIAANTAGESLASGGDVDGDGVPDLVVGGTGARVGGTQLGTVWLVPGAHLLTLVSTELPVPELPRGGGTVLEPLVPATGRFGLLGTTESGDFGSAVALVADPAEPSRMVVAVGIPQGQEGGVQFGGGVHLYRYDAAAPGLSPVPFAVVGGETHVPGGRLGHSLASGSVGGVTSLVVGAPRSSQQGLELGGVYVVRIAP